ncbi:hypothetical protein BP6252_01587 [Coleophoma cylindrospora]|uniref:Pentacotripeptide-repeat region of PRORP domain-containing protein n=1 Tax=Coleophoma cylindrospora TaxID=1849047 RepID=A0A3D8STD2_9HELO|nr:hypothetical protein BP6252_01587 [Coleophoma cylindrospora]
MLRCQDCIRNCLKTFIGEHASSASISIRGGSTIARNRQSLNRNYRSFGTASASPVELERPEDYTPIKPKALTTPANQEKYQSRTKQRQEWFNSRGVTPVAKKRLEPANIKKHLKFLKDPVKLADDVRRMLRDDDYETALEVVKAASKDMQCVVSWNHIIDWQVSKRKLTAAIKTYNDMKKRAQFPDPVTYTLLFRGCADDPHSKNALSKAVSIYQSMLGEFSRVKPTTIHLNAVLKACARAQDMDALWAIAGDMPERGLRAPNNLTYTTIINALRFEAAGDLRGTLTPMQKRQNVEKNLFLARKLWVDILKRWRAGDLFIDEECVCAMGRILLIGGEKDVDDVFSLLEQTMDIPRQLPRYGTDERAALDPTKQTGTPGQTKSIEEPAGISISTDEHSIDIVPALQTSKKPASAKALAPMAKPGQNTLSLALSALTVNGLKGPATQYWNLLTKGHGIIPDSNNYAAYLRILRIARASREATELIISMPPSELRRQHLIIGMSACARDKANRNSFAHAGKLLDLMQHNFSTPDIKVLQSYLTTAVSSPAYFRSPSGAISDQTSEYALGRQILRALDRLEPHINNAKSRITHGEDSPRLHQNYRKQLSEDIEFAELTIQLWGNMVRAYDLCMSRTLVPQEQFSGLAGRRNTLIAWITRYNAKTNSQKQHARSIREKARAE